MGYQGFRFRGVVLALFTMAASAGLAGCASTGETNGGCGGGGGGPRPMLNPSYVSFTIAKDASDPALLAVSPGYGDAWLDSEPTDPSPGENKNKIVWTFTESFDIKFVQIDDPTKNPRRKFGPTQQNGWNPANCGTTGTPCMFELPLFKGNGNARKEIRGAKYSIRSPSGCTTNCAYLDPVIIVRY